MPHRSGNMFFCDWLLDIMCSKFIMLEHVAAIPSLGFPGSSEVKASACNAGDLGSIPGSGKSPGEGNGNPLQYSCLENSMDSKLQSTGSQRVRHD